MYRDSESSTVNRSAGITLLRLDYGLDLILVPIEVTLAPRD